MKHIEQFVVINTDLEEMTSESTIQPSEIDRYASYYRTASLSMIVPFAIITASKIFADQFC